MRWPQRLRDDRRGDVLQRGTADEADVGGRRRRSAARPAHGRHGRGGGGGRCAHQPARPELGFAGALVLPPFYYKGVPSDGVVRYIDRIVVAMAARAVPIYLYNFPALSGVAYDVALVARLIGTLGERMAGLKDSSGDVPYERELAAAHPQFDVFPANEAMLGEARKGPFAGCISATANLNSSLCALWLRGDDAALATAVKIRKLFDGRQLVPGIKALLAHIHGDADLARVMPPMVETTAADVKEIIGGYEQPAYQTVRPRSGGCLM